MKPPFPYYGGKQTLAERIVAMLPPHTHYVEPFAGSLAVLLAKPPSQMETVNDLDAEVVAFWRVLRERPDDLERACRLTPHSRAEFEDCRDNTSGDDLELARRIWVKFTQGRGANDNTTGWRYAATPALATPVAETLTSYIGRFAPLAIRLRRVALECRPAADVIPEYGAHPGVLIYADPPYLRSTRGGTGYRYEMPTEQEHRELAEMLRACRASVVLSGYPSQMYDAELFSDWCRYELKSHTTQGKGDRARTEVIWSNRELAGQADLFTGGAA